jgi:formate dehydrogenase major subunit
VQSARGTVAIVEEQRFRLHTTDGRALLLTLAEDASIGLAELARLHAAGTVVEVAYEGRPNLASGVARDVRVPGAAPPHRPRGLSERVRGALREWSVPRQLAGEDPLGAAAQTRRSRDLRPRLEEADRVGTSICPYCAVGCAQLVYAKGDTIIHVEGDPRSPINQGTLCPKGAATVGWLMNPARLARVKYRAPHATAWREVSLEWAMDRIAWLVKRTRDETFVRTLPDGITVNHTLGIAELGGATLDNEENYLIKKLCAGGLGMVFVENQARV